ncbi:MAG: hypothetical protein PHD74_04970, partial [Candidatus Krumholzibacteria bacterium]|nr:hypothetical protein [Candidatus Krumholzibacteria bacterium]
NPLAMIHAAPPVHLSILFFCAELFSPRQLDDHTLRCTDFSAIRMGAIDLNRIVGDPQWL